MTELVETNHAGGFLVSEGNGSISREAITVLSGQNLQAGAVLGKVATASTGTPTADAGNTGDGTIGAVTVGAKGKVGTYKVTCIEPAVDGGTFTVEDPDGKEIGVAKVGSAFSKGGLGFTIADGAADFAAGDSFDIVVAEGSGKYKELDPAATDGSDVAAGILYDALDASSADAAGVGIVRNAEVNAAELVWKTGMTAGEIATATEGLAALEIIAR